jgi:hypothetical protein
MAYCALTDLEKIRPNISALGGDGATFADQITEADSFVNRELERWYETVAPDHDIDPYSTPFSSDQMPDDGLQVKRAACYKALELIYLYLSNDTPDPDGFMRQSDHFAKKYSDEIRTTLSLGIKYDWDDDGVVDEGEKYERGHWELTRC